MPQIKKICIVGGGSAGWMTAALLGKKLPKDTEISLVESPKVATVGVGESTLGHINRYLDMLELKDEDWMSECNATYKTSIRFSDFKEKDGSSFQYPFGTMLFDHTSNGIMDYFWYQAYNDNPYDSSEFAGWALNQTIMTDQNKLYDNADEEQKIRAFDFHLNTAYHMDAEKFGQYLKNKIAIPEGVKHFFDTIKDVKQDKNGNIVELIGEEQSYVADLYIDCTGFTKLLIEKIMKTKFISFDDVLMNDRALATRIPYNDKESEMHSYTDCTAIENGWVWDIPLYHRRGTGYVHSSKFVDWETAEQEFKKYLKEKRKLTQEQIDSLTFNKINIRHGVQDIPWKNNVCAIGLALGFIEPLESTGLLTTHENIIRLVATLTRRDGIVNKIDIDGWNSAARYELDNFKQFVSLHYGLSQRRDTPYWRHCTEVVDYIPKPLESLDNSAQDYAYRMNTRISLDGDTNDGKYFILAGMGYNPVSKAMAEMEAYRYPGLPSIWQNVMDRHEKHKQEVLELCKTLPTHYQYLKEKFYDGKD
jgi:hypothetical protein